MNRNYANRKDSSFDLAEKLVILGTVAALGLVPYGVYDSLKNAGYNMQPQRIISDVDNQRERILQRAREDLQVAIEENRRALDEAQRKIAEKDCPPPWEGADPNQRYFLPGDPCPYFMGKGPFDLPLPAR